DPGLDFYTPDRRFLLEFTSDYAGMRQLVEDVYTEDPGVAGRLIEAIRWELTTELEDNARRWRDGRLRDVGVPEFEEAVSFYARPAQHRSEQSAGPATQALVAPRGPLLDAALERLGGDDLESAEEAIVYAANAALVANRVPLDDADEVREQLGDARATLSLGLELLSGGDPARAARILVDQPIRSVVQAAMGEAYRLQARARKMAAKARLPQAQSVTVLDEPLESVVQALLRPRPAFQDPGQRRARAFGSRAEVARAEALLDEAEATLALLSALELSPARLGPKAGEAGLGPGVVMASLGVRALLASRARGEPFSLRGAADESPEKPAGFEEKLEQLLRSSVHDDAGRRAADRLRSRLT